MLDGLAARIWLRGKVPEAVADNGKEHRYALCVARTGMRYVLLVYAHETRDAVAIAAQD